MKWKPVMTVTTGPDGKDVIEKSRQYFYVCDLKPTVGGGKRGGKLSQTRLSFVRTTPELVVSDDISGGAAREKDSNDFSLSTPSVGQHGTLVEQVIDEKGRK